MQRIRTQNVVSLLLFLSIIGAGVVSLKITTEANVNEFQFHNAYRVKHVIEITQKPRAAAAATAQLLEDNGIPQTTITTYRAINHGISGSVDNEAKELRLLEITANGFDDGPAAYLIATTSSDSCSSSSRNGALPVWKIDKGTSNGTFRVEINHDAGKANGKTLFLCVYNDDWTMSQHLGEVTHFNPNNG